MKYFNKHLGELKKEKIGINERIVRFKKEVGFCLVSTLTIFIFGLVGFTVAERGLILAVLTTDVHVRQQITAELALTVASADLNLSPDIPGLTGGTGNVNTVVTVVTNNNTGYTVTVVGAPDSTLPMRMTGETQGGYINDYSSLVSQTWSNTTAGQASQYGFGITNGGKQNLATGYTACSNVEHCWARVPTTTPIQVMNVATETLIAGDTFTLKFRVHLPSNSNPLPPEDYYHASTTITAAMI